VAEFPSEEEELAHDGDPPSGPFPLPVRGDTAARPASDRRRPARYCYLFDVDEELAGDLDLRMRLVARPLVTARVEQISAGEFDLVPLLAQRSQPETVRCGWSLRSRWCWRRPWCGSGR